MAKDTKKRAMIYSNVKENKKRAEELSKIRENQINLNDEVIIGLSNDEQKTNHKSKQQTKKAKTNGKKKPKSKNKVRVPIVAKIMLIVALAVVCIIIFLRTSLFDIKNITVSIQNNSILTELEIKELSQIQVGQNMYSINKKDAIEAIKSNPYVENVTIKRSLPNKIKIEVEERTVKFQLEYGDKYIYVDNQGYILETGEKKNDVIVVYGYSTEDLTYGSRLNVSDLESLSDVIQIIKEAENNNLESEITKIDISDKDNYKLYFENQGKVVHLGNVNSINDKLTYVKKILEMESDYEGEIFVNVDLNNGEYPYFREQV